MQAFAPAILVYVRSLRGKNLSLFGCDQQSLHGSLVFDPDDLVERTPEPKAINLRFLLTSTNLGQHVEFVFLLCLHVFKNRLMSCHQREVAQLIVCTTSGDRVE